MGCGGSVCQKTRSSGNLEKPSRAPFSRLSTAEWPDRRKSISSLQDGNLDFRSTSFADEKRFAGMTNEKAVIRGSRQ